MKNSTLYTSKEKNYRLRSTQYQKAEFLVNLKPFIRSRVLPAKPTHPQTHTLVVRHPLPPVVVILVLVFVCWKIVCTLLECTSYSSRWVGLLLLDKKSHYVDTVDHIYHHVLIHRHHHHHHKHYHIWQ